MLFPEVVIEENQAYLNESSSIRKSQSKPDELMENDFFSISCYGLPFKKHLNFIK